MRMLLWLLASIASLAWAEEWRLNKFPPLTQIDKGYFNRPVTECDVCPIMIIVPPGEFEMGSPPSEAGRKQNEGPVHRVAITQPFAIGQYEVTIKEFGAFIADTSYVTTAEKNIGEPGCWGWPDGNSPRRSDTKWNEGYSWKKTGTNTGARHPVRCVSIEDANAYAQWLNSKTEGGYRLPSEAEWEYAARAGAATPWFWGDMKAAACKFANVNDLSGARLRKNIECTDGDYLTAKVGAYMPSPFGLYDTAGNVAEWVADCYHDNYDNAPIDGSVWNSSCGKTGVVRGGYFAMLDDPIHGVRSAAREASHPLNRADFIGFRVARTLK